MEQDDQFVTVVISQLVKSGCEGDYEIWLKNITSVARTYLGHLGTNVIRPQLGVRNEYVIIFRFDNYENLKAWMTSRDREYWLTQAQSLVESDPYVQEICGLEAWFSIPGQPLKTPPRYKIALLTWAAVFVLINILSTFLVPLLRGLPPLIISLIVTIMMVVLLTYVVMPRVSRLFRWWLYAK
ncbi:antibiotic biosynthesis monooxygenase [Nostoc sp. UCD121]|uniref:antibiotic biosynthesis monooxygenase n=1 Tax=unclassified Nostoc TaxID=2593658 RepID=UPI0016237D08|nr:MULTISPECIES: antibiotic biosynthesis monooxygenase [unclassified Nostoc]MBC1224605.1 antibiotic biosynthesis monooxygenase [Nostoc sp. UCD120]MBC1276978.1 antibiotic biosynthesis monooxygenase [Nostoc sp. UCD121]MBC1294379.1 antibiotic biosynthesis monooxygenase [Nostoc sp. UCD122]